MKEEKKALRLDIRKRREALTPQYRLDAGKGIAKAVTESRLFREAKVIFIYM